MTILIGFFLPALIGLITRFIKDKDGRFWASAAIAGVIGVCVDFINKNGVAGYSDFTMLEVAESISTSIMAMVGMVKISYEAVWNNRVVDGKSPLEKLELKP
jgi:drug/metabolite transporter (DMT)-like permease